MTDTREEVEALAARLAGHAWLAPEVIASTGPMLLRLLPRAEAAEGALGLMLGEERAAVLARIEERRKSIGMGARRTQHRFRISPVDSDEEA